MNPFVEHPHLATSRCPGRVRVDLHSHTMWSGDSTTTLDEVLAAVVGPDGDPIIDVLCVTDHHAINGAERLTEVLPCRVVVGEEVRTTRGELIGLFLTERIPFGMSPSDTAKAIRDQGGLTYVPHPFDPMRHAMVPDATRELASLGLLDAIEVFNAKTALASLNERAVELARELNLAAGAGSDAHVPFAIGAAYVEMDDFGSPVEFLASLGTATVIGHHWDKPRPWTARIVPSIAP